jgi:hypothetical protein
MKTILSILATLALAFTYGTAFAEHELGKYESTDVIDAYRTFAHSDDMMGRVGAAAGGPRIEKAAGVWDGLFGNYESTDVIDAYRTFPGSELTTGAAGAAAGGLRAVDDKGSRVFDNMFGNYESTDVIDPYRTFPK